MPRSSFFRASWLAVSLLLVLTAAEGFSTTLNGTPTSFRSVFTIPASADEGAQLVSNIVDPEAVDAQQVCPGYKSSDLERSERGLSATLTLACEPCNAYGIDIEALRLTVEIQAKGRLAVSIVPKYLVSRLDARVEKY